MRVLFKSRSLMARMIKQPQLRRQKPREIIRSLRKKKKEMFLTVFSSLVFKSIHYVCVGTHHPAGLLFQVVRLFFFLMKAFTPQHQLL